MAEAAPGACLKTGGTGILPVQISHHDMSHGQDARATGVAPIDLSDRRIYRGFGRPAHAAPMSSLKLL